jgi:hypothetical protein
MLLADHLIEARGPDAIGERLSHRLTLREEAPGCGFAPHASTLSYEVIAASYAGGSDWLYIRGIRTMDKNLLFEWDDAKSEKNLRERGLDFDRASRIFQNDVVEEEAIGETTAR